MYRLAFFDFEIQHRSKITNSANDLLRCSDYIEDEIVYENILFTLAKKLQFVDKLPNSIQVQIAILNCLEVRTDILYCFVKRIQKVAKKDSIKGLFVIIQTVNVNSNRTTQFRRRKSDVHSKTQKVSSFQNGKTFHPTRLQLAIQTIIATITRSAI